MPFVGLSRALRWAALSLLLPAAALAQGAVAGTVVDDASGIALTGVVVRVEGTTREALTDRTGRFLLTGLPTGRQEIVTRYIGYAVGPGHRHRRGGAHGQHDFPAPVGHDRPRHPRGDCHA